MIRSFVLVPKDGKRVMRHKPGPYLTFALELPEKEPIKRNYSVSSRPEDRSYRISVKHEAKHGRGAEPQSLRVFRSCRRAAGCLKGQS